jgi:NADH:ubiquinone oxidoreductase subunit B-like Fe-S oxidoreductase
MKVRQAYEGRVIEARSSELKGGGWDCEFSIEERETTGVTETAFYVPGVFPTPEAAILAAVTAGKQKIDSGFEYRSVVEYRE